MTIELTKYFSNRASVRSFDPALHISDYTLAHIAELASQAPNTGNMQLYSVVATRDEKLKKELAALHYNQPAATGADVLLTVCADTRRFAAWCDNRKATSGLDNFGGRLQATVDAAIFAQQLVTVAELDGIGCCYLGTAMYNADAIVSLLHLPAGVVPIVGIAMGYPAAKGQASDRLPVDAILHKETYRDYTPAQIDDYYSEKENLEESALFIAENGKETLAQVYADVRYPEATNQAVGEAMLRLLQ